MKSMLVILFSAMLTNNFVLSKFMGICPFLGVSKKLDSAAGMGAAVTFVMVCATICTYPVYTFLLAPFGLEYLKTVAFILIIALFVQLIEMILKKKIPSLYESLGVYLPLITTNCAVLGVTILNIDNGYNFGESIVDALGAGLGFTLALLIFSGVRSRVDKADIPETFKGVPATLIAASIVSVSFMSFSGMVEGIFG
ncbi:MAG: electron transport complex subunit RsxA [Oscillospiraceae bacterium]|nr:electron transport complex subunit RsxA [Oscillospiraceae bacterium]MCI7497937.1 electron transport complex subunit RsxA [Oscillospiraceae bacterium]MDD7279502.1 electron transport complex subunit RsxA [Oscillospiraceae bacterium]MDY2864634.1 electron transport complex subunit RsxA [Oscillospiraceae bacterium]